MSAHTPEPWSIREDLSDDCHIVIDAGEGVGGILIERCVAGHDQHDMPNARLVIAAPDLLAALKELMELVKNWDSPFLDDDQWPESDERIKAAIAKAEGSGE